MKSLSAAAGGEGPRTPGGEGKGPKGRRPGTAKGGEGVSSGLKRNLKGIGGGTSRGRENEPSVVWYHGTMADHQAPATKVPGKGKKKSKKIKNPRGARFKGKRDHMPMKGGGEKKIGQGDRSGPVQGRDGGDGGTLRSGRGGEQKRKNILPSTLGRSQN